MERCLLLNETPGAGPISELLSWKTYIFVESRALPGSAIIYFLLMLRYLANIEAVTLLDSVRLRAVVDCSIEDVVSMLRVIFDSELLL